MISWIFCLISLLSKYTIGFVVREAELSVAINVSVLTLAMSENKFKCPYQFFLILHMPSSI